MSKKCKVPFIYFSGSDPPPADIGSPGDIYVCPALSDPGVLVHPHFAAHILWPMKNAFGWYSASTVNTERREVRGLVKDEDAETETKILIECTLQLLEGNIQGVYKTAGKRPTADSWTGPQKKARLMGLSESPSLSSGPNGELLTLRLENHLDAYCGEPNTNGCTRSAEEVRQQIATAAQLEEENTDTRISHDQQMTPMEHLETNAALTQSPREQAASLEHLEAENAALTVFSSKLRPHPSSSLPETVAARGITAVLCTFFVDVLLANYPYLPFCPSGSPTSTLYACLPVRGETECGTWTRWSAVQCDKVKISDPGIYVHPWFPAHLLWPVGPTFGWYSVNTVNNTRHDTRSLLENEDVEAATKILVAYTLQARAKWMGQKRQIADKREPCSSRSHRGRDVGVQVENHWDAYSGTTRVREERQQEAAAARLAAGNGALTTSHEDQDLRRSIGISSNVSTSHRDSPRRKPRNKTRRAEELRQQMETGARLEEENATLRKSHGEQATLMERLEAEYAALKKSHGDQATSMERSEAENAALRKSHGDQAIFMQRLQAEYEALKKLHEESMQRLAADNAALKSVVDEASKTQQQSLPPIALERMPFHPEFLVFMRETFTSEAMRICNAQRIAAESAALDAATAVSKFAGPSIASSTSLPEIDQPVRCPTVRLGSLHSNKMDFFTASIGRFDELSADKPMMAYIIECPLLRKPIARQFATSAAFRRMNLAGVDYDRPYWTKPQCCRINAHEYASDAHQCAPSAISRNFDPKQAQNGSPLNFSDLNSPAPFPMSLPEVSLPYPPVSVENVLPSLAQFDAAFFNDILRRLQALSPPFVARARTPPPQLTRTVIDVDAADPITSLSVAGARGSTIPESKPQPLAVAIIDSLPPTRVKSIVFVNLQNQNTEDPGLSFAHIVFLPPNPFASQIFVALNDTCSRFATITGKWSLPRVLIAYSKKLIRVTDRGYNDGFSGYREVGFHQDVVGRFEVTGHGGAMDVTVPQILENKDARDFRELYELPLDAHIFSIYIFHTSGHGLPTNLETQSESEPSPAPASTRPSVPIATYLETKFSSAILLCRAFATSTLGTYKRFAMIRHIRFMAERLDMVWPETAAYPKPVAVISGTEPITITIEALLGITDYSVSLGTFKNHIAAFRSCVRAYDHLKKVQGQGGVLTDDQQRAGALLFILLEAEFLDPRVANFVVPPAYALAVTESVASLTAQATKIVVS
ncbi:hypothetical protein C8R45DRAFT_936138 [Mycena sanguinolenta]|nr:hypothetical protein C8R45DRAFT_936138 [Mycena sanguinolenta]